MSSECRCHTDENFCFYCEMYVPLERKCEGLLFERDKAIDEMRHRTKKQRAAHFKTESQLLLAVKALEDMVEVYRPTDNNSGFCPCPMCGVLENAISALEEIKRISTEGRNEK